MRKDDLSGKKTALLLDFDGTLVDLAPDPMAISVDPALVGALNRLLTKTRTPVAIVTGRQVGVLDAFLGLPGLPVSGNHGTEIRPPGSKRVMRRALPMPAELRLALESLRTEFGCLLEDKNETAVLHAPNDAAFHAARNELQKLFTERFQNYTLWLSGLSLEVLCTGFSKITGIRDLLGSRFFKGYSPVYIGDDVETYPALDDLAADGVGLVPVSQTAEHGFSSPAEVREFLIALSLQKAEEDAALPALVAEFGFLYRGL